MTEHKMEFDTFISHPYRWKLVLEMNGAMKELETRIREEALNPFHKNNLEYTSMNLAAMQLDCMKDFLNAPVALLEKLENLPK